MFNLLIKLIKLNIGSNNIKSKKNGHKISKKCNNNFYHNNKDKDQEIKIILIKIITKIIIILIIITK
jgi:hypothetical protein